MQILFLTPELPYPPRGGGLVKTATLLDHLASRHDVDLMSLRRSELTEEQSSWVDRFGTVVTAAVRGERTPVNLLRSYAASVPLSIFRNRSARFAALVREQLAARNHEVIFADSWLMAQYLPPDFGGVKALHQHNAEFVMWERQAQMETNSVRRALVRREAARVRAYEASTLRRFDVVFAVSEPDRRALQGLVGERLHIELLPNVAEPGLLDRPALSPAGLEPVILYLGTLSWQPNLQGLRHFLRSVFPEVRRRLPHARLVVAGSGAPRDLIRQAGRTPGVELIGAFHDPEPLYRRARAFVEAARGGSGTRVKVLNAMARGLPVVTTPDGAEGLDIRAGEHALIGFTPPEISEGLVRVMTDDHVWTALSENGRRLVREQYAPDRAYRALDEVFAAERG